MILYGASGHAKVIRDIVEASGGFVTKLIDDNPAVLELQGLPVYHNYSYIDEPVIVSIGNNAIRKHVVGQLKVQYTSAIHPTAIISPSATIGNGTVVMHGAIIQAETKIGQHCIINTGASLDHEAIIADYVHISPHATLCGNVTVGEGTWIGAGATIIQGVHIGRWSIIGAGSVVTKDIPDYVIAYGNPCTMERNNNLTIKEMKQEKNNLGGGGVNTE